MKRQGDFALYLIMSFIKRHIYPLILIILCLIICRLNYQSGTFLTGWDTLHPEFNFPLNFSRLFNGVWRTEQGLGAIAGHSHMADLPRVILLWLFHFILPLNFLRYAYIFFCFVVGPLGIFYLINYLFKNKLAAFTTAVFYIFNLGTVQQFYTPFEMFPTQWAFLPFIILSSLKYLKENNQKNLFYFSLITLLSSPQAYAAHLWYAFFAVYTIFLMSHYFFYRNKKIFKLFFFTLALNAFWLLPNLYYLFSSSSIPQNTKVNRLYSQEYLLQNRTTGYLRDAALIKGFYFNWQVYNPEQAKFEPLMAAWNQHLAQPLIPFIGYLLFFLSLAGLIISFVKKNKILISLSPFWLIPFILLMNHTPPFSYLFNFLIKYTLFQEAFRFIFTKISIMFTFGIALYLAYFLNIFKLKVLNLPIILASLIFAFPVFRSQLISPKLRVKIPDEYFQFWQYVNTLPQGKTLPLPLHNFAGWQYYNWGYQGAGFIWFNLKQPILDRDFDRWAPQNEEAYREFFYSLYRRDPAVLAATLQKYHFKYILWDKSIITPYRKNREQIVFENEILNLLNQLEKEKIISRDKNFGFLSLYRVDSPDWIKPKYVTNYVKEPYLWSYWDPIFLNQGNYYTDSSDYFNHNQLLDKNERVNYQNILPYLDLDQVKNYFPNVKHYKTFNRSTGNFLVIPELAHNQAYLVGFNSRYLTGLPLRICLKNTYNNICTVYEQLSKNKNFAWDYYLIPPQDNFFGFEITVDNISLGSYPTENELAEIRIIPVDFDKLTQNTNIIAQPRLIISNLQSYHPGWIAFYFNGFKPVRLKNHLLVNNWANGWVVDRLPDGRVYYLFWPQLLEYLGFIFAISILIHDLRQRKTPA